MDICGPSPWLGDRGRACHEQGDATCWGVLWFGMGRCCSPQLKKQRIYAIRVTVPRMKTRKSPAASAILNFLAPSQWHMTTMIGILPLYDLTGTNEYGCALTDTIPVLPLLGSIRTLGSYSQRLARPSRTLHEGCRMTTSGSNLWASQPQMEG